MFAGGCSGTTIGDHADDDSRPVADAASFPATFVPEGFGPLCKAKSVSCCLFFSHHNKKNDDVPMTMTTITITTTINHNDIDNKSYNNNSKDDNDNDNDNNNGSGFSQ